MEVVGIRIFSDPVVTLSIVLFLFGGIGLGIISGLTPGLHANNFALFLAAITPSLPGPPMAVGAAMLAAGVVHTFLDVVPAVAFGVPDADMAATALPAHRLVLEGRGREVLRLSALGSGLAVICAIPLAIPITLSMIELYPVIRPRMALILTVIVMYMILTEPTRLARIGAFVAFGASAMLGSITFDLTTQPVLDAGGVLAPLFAGLFGAPVLIDAIGGTGVPPQHDDRVTVSPRFIGIAALAGGLAGAIVGYLPGVSSAIAAVIVLAMLPSAADARGFVIATSGINTSNTIFALFALVTFGTPRTGVLVAVDQAGIPLNLPLLMIAVLCASAVAFPLVWLIGDPYLRIIGQVNYTTLSIGILIGLVFVAYLFAGPIGIMIFIVSTILGLFPYRLGARRVHLMGVLYPAIVL